MGTRDNIHTMEKLNYVEKLHNFLHKKKELKPEILFTYKQVGGETVWQGKCSYVGKNYLVKGKSKKEVEHKIYKEIFELLLQESSCRGLDYAKTPASSLSTVKRNRKHRGNPSQARRDRKFKEKMSRFENFVWTILVCQLASWEMLKTGRMTPTRVPWPVSILRPQLSAQLVVTG